VEEVKQNIQTGILELEGELIGDTTHYYANSSFETVEYTDEKGKKTEKITIKAYLCVARRQGLKYEREKFIYQAPKDSGFQCV